MSEFFLGQIMLTGFGFPQKGFAQCNGQLMAISQNQALFALLGTYYGGNGTSNFQLPDLRGRAPAGFGSSTDPSWQPPPYAIGQQAGAETVAVPPGGLPMHTHTVQGSTQTSSINTLDGALWGQTSGATPEAIYTPTGGGALVPLDPTSIDPAGGGAPHPNMQLFQVINFNIAITGVFPSRN